MPKEVDDVMKKQDELLTEREYKKKEQLKARIADEEWNEALTGALKKSARKRDEI